MGFRIREKAKKPCFIFLDNLRKVSGGACFMATPRECPEAEESECPHYSLPLVRSCSPHKHFAFMKKSLQALDFIYNDNLRIFIT